LSSHNSKDVVSKPRDFFGSSIGNITAAQGAVGARWQLCDKGRWGEGLLCFTVFLFIMHDADPSLKAIKRRVPTSSRYDHIENDPEHHYRQPTRFTNLI
jgi:hypothetical protein